MPAAVIPADIAQQIGSSSGVALLSAETMRKQALRHAELTTTDYRALRGVIETPLLIVRDTSRSMVAISKAGTRYRYAAIKTTSTGRALFVVSYRYADAADIDRLLRRPGATIIFDGR